jgi:hypothetical protein
MIISLPYIREPKGRIVRGSITQFYAREDLRFEEEGMGVKPKPQTKLGRL